MCSAPSASSTTRVIPAAVCSAQYSTQFTRSASKLCIEPRSPPHCQKWRSSELVSDQLSPARMAADRLGVRSSRDNLSRLGVPVKHQPHPLQERISQASSLSHHLTA